MRGLTRAIVLPVRSAALSAGRSMARSARSMEPSELIIATIITIYNRDYRRDCR